MNCIEELGLLAVSDTQLFVGVIVGLLLLWILIRVMKMMAGLFVKIVLILLVLAVAGGVVWVLAKP